MATRRLLFSSCRGFATQPSSGKKGLDSLSGNQLQGKNVFCRLDLNVPLDKKSGAISDDTRIRASLPTIQYLKKHGAKIVLTSHLGQPKEPNQKDSLAPVAKRLSELLNTSVNFSNEVVGDSVKTHVANLKNGDILLLENVRFVKGETKNDDKFSKQLAEVTNASVFVNDAFGAAHRAHSSTAGVAKFIKGPAVAGFLMEKELRYLKGALDHPAKPFAAIVGGAKVSTKITVLESLTAKCDKLVVGGAMIFTFFKARNLKVGASKVEDDFLTVATSLEKKAKEKGVDLILPVDVVVAKEFKENAEFKVVPFDQIPDGWMGLDVGPESIKLINKSLSSCKTILWNGPLGVFEFPNFAKGTFSVAHTLADLTKKGVVTVVGGGDSVSAVQSAKLIDQMSHVSTGGGASLELIEGKELPGVACLNDA